MLNSINELVLSFAYQYGKWRYRKNRQYRKVKKQRAPEIVSSQAFNGIVRINLLFPKAKHHAYLQSKRATDKHPPQDY